jgi:hypothetical protein
MTFYLYILGLFNDAPSLSNYTSSKDKIISEERIEKYAEGRGRGLI